MVAARVWYGEEEGEEEGEVLAMVVIGACCC